MDQSNLPVSDKMSPRQTARRWIVMAEYAYQCTDSPEFRSSSGMTPRAYELQLLEEEMVSALSALRRLHDWAVAQEGGCVFSGDHPIAVAAEIMEAKQ
jgi:hypothetical protein